MSDIVKIEEEQYPNVGGLQYVGGKTQQFFLPIDPLLKIELPSVRIKLLDYGARGSPLDLPDSLHDPRTPSFRGAFRKAESLGGGLVGVSRGDKEVVEFLHVGSELLARSSKDLLPDVR